VRKVGRLNINVGRLSYIIERHDIIILVRYVA